jgi:hypothetical protein
MTGMKHDEFSNLFNICIYLSKILRGLVVVRKVLVTKVDYVKCRVHCLPSTELNYLLY